jgi:hypothetical protein
MKICGTVERPFAFASISSRRSGFPVISISVKAMPFWSRRSFAAMQ